MHRPVRLRTTLKATVLLVAAGTVAAACSHAAPPPPPTPAPTHADDGAARAAKARDDSIAKVRAADYAALRRKAAHDDSLQRETMALMTRQSELRDVLIASVHFDFDKSNIRDVDRDELDRKAAILVANGTVQLDIRGDADERGSDEYNLALGMRRAVEARRYLASHGVDTTRIRIASNGESHPFCVEHTEACWADNRRDEFLIIDAPNLLKEGQTAAGGR